MRNSVFCILVAVLAGCVHGSPGSAATSVTRVSECPGRLNGPALPPDAPEALRQAYLGISYTHASAKGLGETPSQIWGSEHWKDAVAEEGEGRIDNAYLFCSAQPVHLWRAWSTHPTEEQAQSGGGPSKQIGKWWAAELPTSARAAFRRAYVVCTRWNRLEHLSRCTVDAGVVFAAGRGNGARCGGTEEYGPSARWQVFIDVDDPSNAGKIHCGDTTEMSE